MSFKLSTNYNDNVIDACDIIARVEALRDKRDNGAQDYLEEQDCPDEPGWRSRQEEDAHELAILENFLSDLKGKGGDEEWEGDWYPETLVNSEYFTEYVYELAEQRMESSMRDWPHCHIDWEASSNDLMQYYEAVELKPMEEYENSTTFYYEYSYS